jgi:hypothetical protein
MNRIRTKFESHCYLVEEAGTLDVSPLEAPTPLQE